MSGQSIQTLKSDWITPPRASAPAASSGFTPPPIMPPVTSAISSTAIVFDLRALGGYAQTTNDPVQGASGRYVTITPDGCDCYFIMGPTLASVTGANAPVAQTAASPNASGITVATPGTCKVIKNGVDASYLTQLNIDVFLAVVTLGAATGFVTVAQSSP